VAVAGGVLGMLAEECMLAAGADRMPLEWLEAVLLGHMDVLHLSGVPLLATPWLVEAEPLLGHMDVLLLSQVRVPLPAEAAEFEAAPLAVPGQADPLRDIGRTMVVF